MLGCVHLLGQGWPGNRASSLHTFRPWGRAVGGGCAGGPQGAEHLQLGPGPQHDSLSGTWGEMEASVWNSARCEKGHGEGEKLGLGKVSTKRTETALLLPLQVSAPCSCLRPPDIHLSGVDLHDSGPGLLVGHRELDLAVQAA